MKFPMICNQIVISSDINIPLFIIQYDLYNHKLLCILPTSIVMEDWEELVKNERNFENIAKVNS